MTPSRQLLMDIEACEISHSMFVSHLTYLRGRIRDAIDGRDSHIERVVGPSRVGKSMLINALKREFPETRVDGRRHVPVLVVPVPTPVSPRLLPSSVLTALGLPVQRSITSGAMDTRMLRQLELAGTRVLMFEEASHLVELGARVPPRAAGDWFKAVADALTLTVFLFGVPRLERLFEHNEQFRLRASAARRFQPYDSRVSEDMQAFRMCVSTYAKLFREAGYPLELEGRALTEQCYLMTGGLVGVLSRFMRELAGQQAGQAPHMLTLADCLSAAGTIEQAGTRWGYQAFAAESVSGNVPPAVLHQAYVQVMKDNDMPVRILNNRAEGVQ